MNTLNFPLYHATSSVFEESIKLHGLGGYSPVIALRAIEFLTHLEEIANKELADNKLWKYFFFKDRIRLITSQTITLAGCNFQHGDVYLTPSLFTAKQYAVGYKYGSEVISIIFDTLDLFNSLSVKIGAKLLADFQNLLAIKELIATPVIYEITNLPIEYLSMGESGQDLDEQINRVIEDISKYGRVMVAQQINFRLKNPIPFDMLTKIS
jgi:hypothetical protein